MAMLCSKADGLYDAHGLIVGGSAQEVDSIQQLTIQEGLPLKFHHCADGMIEAVGAASRVLTIVLLDLDSAARLEDLQRALLTVASVPFVVIGERIRASLLGPYLSTDDPEHTTRLVRFMRHALAVARQREQVLRLFCACFSLTPRQRRALSLAFSGADRKQIAQQLKVTERTLKASVQEILQKTGAESLSGLVQRIHSWSQYCFSVREDMVIERDCSHIYPVHYVQRDDLSHGR